MLRRLSFRDLTTARPRDRARWDTRRWDPPRFRSRRHELHGSDPTGPPTCHLTTPHPPASSPLQLTTPDRLAPATHEAQRPSVLHDYPTSRPRRRWYSSSESFPSLFMRSSFSSSSATLKPTACRSSSWACTGCPRAPLRHAGVLRDEVDEHAEPRHHDHEDHPEGLDPAADVVAPEDVDEHRDHEPEQDHPRKDVQNAQEKIAERPVSAEHHAEPPSKDGRREYGPENSKTLPTARSNARPEPLPPRRARLSRGRCRRNGSRDPRARRPRCR